MDKLKSLFLVIIESVIAIFILYYLRPVLIASDSYEISTILPILLDISFLAIFASFGARLAKIFNIAPMAGKIFMGIIIGPALFGAIDPYAQGVEIARLAGIFFILFEAGLYFDLAILKKNFGSNILSAVSATLVQLALFSLVGFYLLDINWLPAIFLGGIFTATSLGLSVSALKAGNKLHTEVGDKILSIALIGNIIGMLLLTILGKFLYGSAGFGDIFLISLSIIGFLFVAFVMWSFNFVDKVVKYLDQHYVTTSTGSYTRFFFGALILACALTSAIGLEPILGAFGIGLILSKMDNKIKNEIWSKIEGYMHIFVGGFLVSLGTMLTRESLFDYHTWLYAIMFVILAFVGKCFIRFFYKNKKEGILIARATTIRGEIGLTFLAIAIFNNVFTESLSSSILLSIVLVSVLGIFLFEREIYKQTNVKPDELGEGM
ncbi:MAG: cation:proton antiporter [Candidatus Magasanikiibacteriota bacterium]